MYLAAQNETVSSLHSHIIKLTLLVTYPTIIFRHSSQRKCKKKNLIQNLFICKVILKLKLSEAYTGWTKNSNAFKRVNLTLSKQLFKTIVIIITGSFYLYLYFLIGPTTNMFSDFFFNQMCDGLVILSSIIYRHLFDHI